jgi:hypothetical protein
MVKHSGASQPDYRAGHTEFKVFATRPYGPKRQNLRHGGRRISRIANEKLTPLTYVTRLIRQHGIAVVPRDAFGLVKGFHLRWIPICQTAVEERAKSAP